MPPTLPTRATPRLVRERDALSAEQWNLIVKRVEDLVRSAMFADQSTVAAALAAMAPDRFIPARIVGVDPPDAYSAPYYPEGGPPPGYEEPDPDDPSPPPPPPDAPPVRYWVEGIGRPGVRLEGVAPVYGRPVRFNQSRIYGARAQNAAANQPGMVCLIVRTNDVEGEPVGELMLLPGSEVLAARVCAAP